MTRLYSSISVETTLASTISSSATTMTVATGTGSALLGGVTLAAGNVDQFTVAIDPDTTNEEIVFITATSGDTFTIVRARSGTSGVQHTAGATIKHVLTSDDLNFFKTAIQPTLVDAKGDIVTATASDTPARLAVGSNEQRLVADSSQATGLKYVSDTTNYAVAAKGDLLAGTAADTVTNLAVGTNEQRLVADSAQASGLKYVSDTTNYAIGAKGDLLVGTAADTVTNLSVGSNNQVLTADSSTASGLKWAATPGATSFPAFRAYATNQQSFSANTWTKVVFDAEAFDTDNTFNTSTYRFTPGVAGYYSVSARMAASSANAYGCEVAIYKNGTIEVSDGGDRAPYPCGNPNAVIYLNTTDYLEVYAYLTFSGGNINGSSACYFSAVGVRS